MGAFDPGDPLPVFGGIPTYLRAPLTEPTEVGSGYVGVCGVTWDHTSPGTIGARFGPKAIREGSIYLGYHLQTAAATVTAMLEVKNLKVGEGLETVARWIKRDLLFES